MSNYLHQRIARLVRSSKINVSKRRRRMKKQVLFVVALIVVLATIAACAPAPTPAPTAAPPTAAAKPTTAPAAPTTAPATGPTATPAPKFTPVPPPAGATKFDFWHAMGGTNGDAIADMMGRFNASQKKCNGTAIFQGSYDDSLNKIKAGLHPKTCRQLRKCTIWQLV